MASARLSQIAKLVRYYILKMTTDAGSGHPTSSLSAADLLTFLFFEKLRYDTANPQNAANDRVIFSKGHASPLFYALWAAAGEVLEKELADYRKFGSPLEGHPTPRFKYAEAATGSLGQGLSIGVGMALAIRLDFAGPAARFPHPTSSLQSNFGMKTTTSTDAAGARRGSPTRVTRNADLPMVYVLMGDSEVAEGSVWEACEIASYYKLGNLVAIVDVNRLGQSGETSLGWDTDTYAKRFEAFGWETYVIDGHDMAQIAKAFAATSGKPAKPQVIIAKTVKGKGVPFLENKEGWHGKTLSKEDFDRAVAELGKIDMEIRGEITGPAARSSRIPASSARGDSKRNQNEDVSLRALDGTPSARVTPNLLPHYKLGEAVATRKAYGEALAALGDSNGDIVCLDGEVKNSTFAEIFKEKHPERFFEMFIAEQNMAGVALGLSRRGKLAFASTFATFWTRAFDQIRMGAYSNGNVKFVGSHAGVSIGEDGPSQMGLEDIAMFRSVFGSTVVCPGDAVACAKLVEKSLTVPGTFYIRTNRPATPVIYKNSESFAIGGSKVVRSSTSDRLTIVACGVTLMEAIAAADELGAGGINVRVIDAYSIKPIDAGGLRKAAGACGNVVITVEDHYPEGGLGDAVLEVFAAEGDVRVYKMAVRKRPMSGRGDELLDYEEISKGAIVKKVREVLR